MTLPEQAGGPPEQPKEESVTGKNAEGASEGDKSERRITTSLEAAEMTRQRRKDFGLGEARQLTPEESAELDKSIDKLLADLDRYDFESYSPEIQDEWYWVEQEAQVGRDRELAKANLERFLQVLQEEAENQKSNKAR